MTNMSNLPQDLTEEVLSRLSLTSLRVARFTCKNWNTILKDRSFAKKYFREAKTAAKRNHEFQMVMMMEYGLYLMRINLLNPSIDRIGKLDADRIDISTIFHCDGLILCITRDKSMLVVWNPYSGQTIWIESSNSNTGFSMYAMGYENKNNSLRSYKILKYNIHYTYRIRDSPLHEFEIFDLNSNLCKVIDVTRDWMIEFYGLGLTLKGNTYWFARGESDVVQFLICFNFTTEKFGPHLPVPFEASFNSTVSLSSVRDEQLAVLYMPAPNTDPTLKIWITNKIEPSAVSWRKLFLEVDMKPVIGTNICRLGGSFFVDEEKNVAMVLHKKPSACTSPFRIFSKNIAYIIGKNGYFKEIDLGYSIEDNCRPLMCSYFPSFE